MDKLEYEYRAYEIDGSYLLLFAVVCFILAGIGIALLVWLFKGKRQP